MAKARCVISAHSWAGDSSQFEKWWGSPVPLNAAEMQYIADELFVGNRLISGEICTGDGPAHRFEKHQGDDRGLLLLRR
jgi:Protein of unknown function (DUF3141)